MRIVQLFFGLILIGGINVSQRIVLAEEVKPLRVFVLAGQSNMQGHAKVSTFEAMRFNERASRLLKDLRPDGSFVTCERVWISSIGSSAEEKVGRLGIGFGAEARGPKIGPEYAFGVYAEKLIDGPILIVKTAWGGKSLHTDFRPPSGGKYEFNDQQLERFKKQGKDIRQIKNEKNEASGRYYRMMIEHVQRVLSDPSKIVPNFNEGQPVELAGFVWFQGWNDMVDSGTYPDRGKPGGYQAYTELMVKLIRDVRRDLDAPELPIVIGVMGVGGPTKLYGPEKKRVRAIHQTFRDAMASAADLPEFENNVTAVLTEDYWDLNVVALRQREQRLKPRLDQLTKARKAGELTREQEQAQRAALFEAEFSNRELVILRDSVSNAEFHYLGSAGIMTQIGKAFAEAVTGLRKSKP